MPRLRATAVAFVPQKTKKPDDARASRAAGAAFGALIRSVLQESCEETAIEALNEARQASLVQEAVYRPPPPPSPPNRRQQRRLVLQAGEGRYRRQLLGKLHTYAADEARPSSWEHDPWLYCSDDARAQ